MATVRSSSSELRKTFSGIVSVSVASTSLWKFGPQNGLIGSKFSPAGQVSIVGQDLHSETHVHGFVTTGDMAKTGAK